MINRADAIAAVSITAAPIARVSLTWLLLAQALVVLPFVQHVPISITLLWLGCTFWRVQVFRMRARLPGTWIKSGLLVGTAGGVYLARGSLVGLDAGAALLVAAFVLKMLEMNNRRDARVLIFLGFFAWRLAICSRTTCCGRFSVCYRSGRCWLR